MSPIGVTADLIGRSTELEAVDRFVARMRLGLTGLVIDGDAGIGKTSIWSRALDEARRDEARILRSAPAESEQDLTLGGVTDLLADVTDDELASIPPVQRHALEIAILRAEPSGQLPDQRTVSVASATLLRHLAALRPVLLAIDDAQWLDGTSAAVLSYAVRRLAEQRVGVLLAVRGAPPARVLEPVAGVPADRRDHLHLGPLPLAALHQLFMARLGRSFPRLALVRIEEASGGNPFYALEIGRALAASGAALTPGVALPIPDTLGALVEARLGTLPAATRHSLLLAAVAVEPTLETLRRADPDAPAALDAAVAAGVIDVRGPSIRFGHPLLAQAVVAAASTAAVRQAHARLAASATSADARARHLGGATDGPSQEVAAALEAAASSARDRGATLDAASLYQQAGRLTPPGDGANATRRAVAAAECLFVDVSEIREADRLLEAAIDGAPPGPARAEALSLRALVRYYHGQTPEAVQLGEQALDEAGDEPLLRAKILGRTAFLVMQLDLARGNALAAEGLRLLGAIDGEREIDADLQANLLLLHASSELGLVHGLLTDEIDRGAALITDNGRSWEHDGADGIDYGLARQLDELDRAIAMTERLIRSKSGPGGDDPFNFVSLSGLQVLRGDWVAARASAAAGVEGYAREGADVFPAWRLRGLALVDACEGHVEEARRLATEGLELALGTGDLALEVYHRHILGFVALSVDEVAEADAQLSAADRAARASGTLHPGRFKLDGDRVEAAIAVGDVERAAGIVEWLEHAGSVAPTPWTLAIGARTRGLVQAARGDLDGSLASLERALDRHEHLPMPFERARTLLTLGQLHRRRRAKRLATDALREALEAFDALGALRWAERARAELGRVGLRPRASADLTETERRVAELAATGLSSREVAERAFLAPKTVGNVLGRVYGKLGIHSRAELGARLGEGSRRDRSG